MPAAAILPAKSASSPGRSCAWTTTTSALACDRHAVHDRERVVHGFGMRHEYVELGLLPLAQVRRGGDVHPGAAQRCGHVGERPRLVVLELDHHVGRHVRLLDGSAPHRSSRVGIASVASVASPSTSNPSGSGHGAGWYNRCGRTERVGMGGSAWQAACRRNDRRRTVSSRPSCLASPSSSTAGRPRPTPASTDRCCPADISGFTLAHRTPRVQGSSRRRGDHQPRQSLLRRTDRDRVRVRR